MNDAPAMRASAIPRDVVLESGERVLIATKPLAVWMPVAILLAALWVASLTALATNNLAAFTTLVVVGVVATLFFGLRWVRWRAQHYILTDRRVIARWGVLDRNQAAMLLSRLQDVTLERPFPLSQLRGYGVLRLETAGEHSSERVSGGLDRLPMEHADDFYRLLTNALTPEKLAR